jgi:hypothetical protein
MHQVAERHDTAVKFVCIDEAGLTALITLHSLPFHCSTRGSTSVPPAPLMPTATQNVGPAQDTPFSSLLPAPTAFGLGTMDHDDPFHCSIRVLLPLPPPPG